MSLRLTCAYRRNAPKSISFQTALTTIALNTALGRLDSAGAIATITTSDSTAATIPVIWLRLRASLAAAVLDKLPATPRPPNRPQATLATPEASSSWSASTR
jgi:hypothetical protein